MEGNQGKQPKETSKNTKSAATTQTSPPRPQIQMRGQKVLQHHRFESTVENCLKNVSYTPNQPKLEPIPHKHWFHSIDSRGRKLSQCSMALNHYHNVEWGMDPETGKLYAKSGPAMHLKTYRQEDGTSEVVPEQVSWPGRKDPKTGKHRLHLDEHVHTWEYHDTEEFTPASMDRQKQHHREEMTREMGGGVTVKAMQTPEPFNAADPATIAPTSSRVDGG